MYDKQIGREEIKTLSLTTLSLSPKCRPSVEGIKAINNEELKAEDIVADRILRSSSSISAEIAEGNSSCEFHDKWI